VARYDRAVMVRDNGWTEEQAQVLLDCLNLSGSVPNWKPEHLQRLHDWCSARRKNYQTIEAQLEFVAYELCSIHTTVGMALKQATTREAARSAVGRYVKTLQR
jgi:hypothetical protein